MAKKDQRIPKEKLRKKIKEHNKHEHEKHLELFQPKTFKAKQETTIKPQSFTLAQIIREKRETKKKQTKKWLEQPQKDIWNHIERLEKKVDYNLNLLTRTKKLKKPEVDEEIWNQFTSLDFVQSMDKFLKSNIVSI